MPGISSLTGKSPSGSVNGGGEGGVREDDVNDREGFQVGRRVSKAF